MTWENSAITIATFLPLVGALVIALVPSRNDRAVRALAIVFTAAALVVAIAIAADFDYGAGTGLQFELDARWIPAISARYHVGIDGISLPLYVLTFALSFLCAIYSWRFIPSPGKTKGFLALMLLLETGMAGTFIAFDLILFFVFWELVLVPMYFLIGIWGSANREYAAIKFFLYTLFGSVFMLLGFLGMFFRSNVGGEHTFDIIALQEFAQTGGFSNGFQLVVFGAVALGFAVKVPMWPFHTWLPDAHTEAPTIGSVLLAGIMLKMGTYGFLRIALPLLPYGAEKYAPYIGALSAIAIVYAALACLAQRDLKRLIAFSSVGHMGFVMLGIATLTPIGINAAIFGMIAHGVVTGMLFFCVGSLYDRYHTRQMAEIGGGVMQKLPYLGGVFAFVAIASLGLPGLAGFWGEVMALLASFSPASSQNLTLFRVFMVAGGIGTILTAGYFLWMLQRVNMGTVPEKWKDQPFPDVVAVEWVSWVPLLIFTVALGVFPRLVFGVTDGPVDAIANLFAGG
ncbi:MAG TPA: NADH-quinone oxidoreductase subunit M [Actinomycetota bacterium]|jgi:NADH-quinone oxidoreductase subunit M|nr:NADH-quinone oxidoreductase subunit M [Actinomycetota bacterium]